MFGFEVVQSLCLWDDRSWGHAIENVLILTVINCNISKKRIFDQKTTLRQSLTWLVKWFKFLTHSINIFLYIAPYL